MSIINAHTLLKSTKFPIFHYIKLFCLSIYRLIQHLFTFSIINMPKMSKILIRLILSIFITCICDSQHTFAAFDYRWLDARSAGMAVSGGSDPTDSSSRQLNPASGAWSENIGFSFTYSTRWNLPELDGFILSTFIPLNSWVFGCSASGFGKKLYTEREVNISVSRRFINRFAIGLGLNSGWLKIDRYGSDNFYSADLGVLVHLEKGDIGASLNNLYSTKLDQFNSEIPKTFGIFTNARLSHRANMYLEAEFQKFYSPSYRFGSEVLISKLLTMRVGYDYGTERIHLGFGINASKLCFNSSYDHHPVLGWSKSFGCTGTIKQGIKPE